MKTLLIFLIFCLAANFVNAQSIAITVTPPNGGENWQVGSSHNITWTSNDVSNVKIEYSANNGTNWTSVISSTSSDGSYR